MSADENGLKIYFFDSLKALRKGRFLLNKKEEIINNKFGVPAVRAHFYWGGIKFYDICPLGCRGEHCSPARFAR